MREREIPINKGNYTMDTEQRLLQFEQYRAEGWEEKYKEYRKNWEEYPKNYEVSDYPLLVDIELSSVCNLKCPMCYTITEQFKCKVKTGLMDIELFYKIIDEIAGKVPAVRLSLRGEPTLHPQFIKCIKYCKEKGIGEVSFLTNCSNMTESFFEKVIDAGADWITISVDGIGEKYESIRYPLIFEETLNKIKMMKRVKESRNIHKPVIKIQGIWPAIKENPNEYYNTFSEYTDLIAFNPLIDYLGKDTDIEYIEEFACPQLYQRMVISSNGHVMSCANDEEEENVVGDVNDSSIHSIWHGNKINIIRKKHKEGNYRDISICKKCYLPRKTEETEHANVNGRDIIIKNYTNRSQNIGE